MNTLYSMTAVNDQRRAELQHQADQHRRLRAARTPAEPITATRAGRRQRAVRWLLQSLNPAG